MAKAILEVLDRPQGDILKYTSPASGLGTDKTHLRSFKFLASLKTMAKWGKEVT